MVLFVVLFVCLSDPLRWAALLVGAGAHAESDGEGGCRVIKRDEYEGGGRCARC